MTNVATDYFFSGHTAIAVRRATEVARLNPRWLAVVAGLVAAFEMATVLVLRAHNTMDLFAGLTTALCAAHLAPAIDRALLMRS
jgi:membrane-associated phospholipid phosphatase